MKKAAKKTAGAKVVRKKAAKRKPNAAFMKPMTPSSVLAAIFGAPLSRGTAAAKIRQHGKKGEAQAIGAPQRVVVRTSLLPESKVADADVRHAMAMARTNKQIF